MTSEIAPTLSDRRGGVRAINLRDSPQADSAPDADEIVVRVDRFNPVLGNRHILRNRNDPRERAEVIARYGRDLRQDIAAGGPMSKQIESLAQRVSNGERLCLACWCKPSACHADLIVKAVELAAQRMKQREVFAAASPPAGAAPVPDREADHALPRSVRFAPAAREHRAR